MCLDAHVPSLAVSVTVEQLWLNLGPTCRLLNIQVFLVAPLGHLVLLQGEFLSEWARKLAMLTLFTLLAHGDCVEHKMGVIEVGMVTCTVD